MARKSTKENITKRKGALRYKLLKEIYAFEDETGVRIGNTLKLTRSKRMGEREGVVVNIEFN